MSNKVKCFDVINDVIKEFRNSTPKKVLISTDAYNLLRTDSAKIDEIIEYGDASSVQVDIEKETGRISVIVVLDDILFDMDENNMNDLIRHVEMMSYWVNEDGDLVSQFIFPSIWEE